MQSLGLDRGPSIAWINIIVSFYSCDASVFIPFNSGRVVPATISFLTTSLLVSCLTSCTHSVCYSRRPSFSSSPSFAPAPTSSLSASKSSTANTNYGNSCRTAPEPVPAPEIDSSPAIIFGITCYQLFAPSHTTWTPAVSPVRNFLIPPGLRCALNLQNSSAASSSLVPHFISAHLI